MSEILGAVFGGGCEIRGEGGMGVSFGTNDGCWVLAEETEGMGDRLSRVEVLGSWVGIDSA